MSCGPTCACGHTAIDHNPTRGKHDDVACKKCECVHWVGKTTAGKYKKAIEQIRKLLYWDYDNERWRSHNEEPGWTGLDELCEIDWILQPDLVPKESRLPKV